MATVTIDTNEWCTPAQLAKNFGVKRQAVNNWYKRGKVEKMYVPELELVLVRVVHHNFHKKVGRKKK